MTNVILFNSGGEPVCVMKDSVGYHVSYLFADNPAFSNAYGIHFRDLDEGVEMNVSTRCGIMAFHVHFTEGAERVKRAIESFA